MKRFSMAASNVVHHGSGTYQVRRWDFDPFDAEEDRCPESQVLGGRTTAGWVGGFGWLLGWLLG